MLLSLSLTLSLTLTRTHTLSLSFISVLFLSSRPAYQHYLDRVLFVGGLLRHENKKTVLHFDVEKWPEYDQPVKATLCQRHFPTIAECCSRWRCCCCCDQSKDAMIFHFGFRRYPCRPIISQNNINSDKHKYEKYLHAGRHDVATIYGPATFVTEDIDAISPPPSRRSN